MATWKNETAIVQEVREVEIKTAQKTNAGRTNNVLERGRAKAVVTALVQAATREVMAKEKANVTDSCPKKCPEGKKVLF
jgi:hypothetical protein